MAKRPRDPNQLAKLIVDIPTGQAEDTLSESKRHPASIRGRAGGLKGGRPELERFRQARDRRLPRRPQGKDGRSENLRLRWCLRVWRFNPQINSSHLLQSIKEFVPAHTVTPLRESIRTRK